MKTRRILAASTAALLAFGTTAAYVASAASAGDLVGYTDVTATSSLTSSDVTAGTAAETVAASVTVKAKKVKVATDDGSGNALTYEAETTDTTLASGSDYTALANYDSTNSKWVISFTTSLKSATAASGEGTTLSIPNVEISVTSSDEDGSAVTASDLTGVSASVASKKNVKGAISFNAGTSYVITGLKTAGKDLDEVTDANYSSANITAALAGLTDATFKNKVGDVTVSMTAKDAKSLKGRYEVKIGTKTVNEDENDKVSFDEDEDITKLKLSAKNVDILKKTDASKVKLIEVNVGKDGDIVNSIGKSLKVTVDKTWAGAKVYHVNSDGSLNEIKASTNNPISGGDKATTFTTANFSPFIITTATLDAKAAAADDTSSAAATSNGSTSTNPNTGIALAIAPVVLAAGAVAVVALKKKH